MTLKRFVIYAKKVLSLEPDVGDNWRKSLNVVF